MLNWDTVEFVLMGVDCLLGGGLLYQIYAAGRRTGEIDANLKQNTDSIADLYDKDRKIHGRIDELVKEIGEANKQLSTLRAGIEAQLHGVDQLAREVRELLKSSVAGETDADHMKDRIKTLEGEMKSLLASSSALDARLGRLATIEQELNYLRNHRST